MNRILAAAAAILAMMVCATTTTVASGAGTSPLHVAPLRYHYRQLANGLRVYAMPDPTTANVAIQVWYGVGSRDDPAGRSGFAHLFEHLMFKATRNLPADSFQRFVEDVGGSFNGSTHPDDTSYYDVVPANHLQRLLWAESERMSSLVVDDATFHSERDVVKEELRQRVLAAPYGRLFFLDLPHANYDVHPYARPTIGSIEDLDAATLDDVRAFHAQYYRPDNAILVVAGNFDEAQFNRWVDQYFGSIAHPARPIPRVTAVEPVRTAPRSYTVYEPNVPLPAVMVCYRQPGARDPDIAALTVLDAILATGDHSRLHDALVYRQQVASDTIKYLDERVDVGTYAVGAILSAGKSPEDALRSLEAEIARVRDEPVTAQELDEAKNEIVTATLRGRETVLGRSAELADAVVRLGDPAAADRLLAAIQRVTTADVQRVARAVLNDNQRVTIQYLSQDANPNAHGDTIATAATVQTHPLAIPVSEVPVVALAPEDQRVAPPPVAAPVSAALPTIHTRVLANGLHVVVASLRGVPLVSANLRVAAGVSSDPAGHTGVSVLTADVVIKGTATRSATDIARQIESLGASLDAFGGGDSSVVALEARSDRIGDALDVMADIAQNAAFASEELDRSRQQEIDQFTQAMQDPGTIATYLTGRALFGNTAYGAVATPANLRAITRAEVLQFHRTYWRPDNATLVIAGDLTAEQGFALAQRHFGGWVHGAEPIPSRPAPSREPVSPQTIVVDLPHTGQAAVYVGTVAVPRSSPDYFPILLTTNVLGGGFSGRLNEEIRVRRGLSYGAFAVLNTRVLAGSIFAGGQTRNDAAVQVAGLVDTEMTRLGVEEVPADELAARKASLIGDFGRAVETNAGIASELSRLAILGVPPEQLGSYVSDVNNVTASQVQTAARRYLDPAHADTIIVGDASAFYDALHAEQPNSQRIEIGELNLDRATLH